MDKGVGRWLQLAGLRENKRVALSAFLAHIVHDGFTDMLYVFLPLWQAQFALTFTAVGFIKTLYSGVMALFQVPVSTVVARWGAARLLVAGTLVTSLAVIMFGTAANPLMLACFLAMAGIGGSVQHPIGSLLIADFCADSKLRRVVLGTYNFSGDLGKLLFPALAVLLMIRLDWSGAVMVLGVVGLAATAAIFVWSKDADTVADRPDKDDTIAGTGGTEGRAPFVALVSIGVLDSATRMGFLTFFPFLLQEKGAHIGLVGVALTLVFAGGAVGKFTCGLLATRLGALRTVILTEIATATCIYGMTIVPLYGGLVLAPLLGMMLNGTSSVLYGSVPELVTAADRSRAFAIFYTATIGSGALSPWLYGFVSDIITVKLSIMLVAVMVLAVIPLTLPLKGKLMS